MDEYSSALGRVLSNLQSLEFCLRLRLSYTDPANLQFSKDLRMTDLKVGQIVVENSLTSYESLGQLIKRYNDTLSTVDQDCQVDPNVIQIRDALAHGRVLSDTLESDPVLLKFSRANNEQVTVEYAQLLSREWLAGQVHRLHDEVMKVNESMRRARVRNGVSGPSV